MTAGPTAPVELGIPGLDRVAWGTHVSHFFRTSCDLRDALVPYFAAGLASGEKCVWRTCPPLPVDAARRMLAHAVPGLAERERAGDIEILDAAGEYANGGVIDGAAALRDWLAREDAALEEGYAGLRIAGNTLWLEDHQWRGFSAYEAAVHRAFRGRKIVALCSYGLDECSLDQLLDVMNHHDTAIVRGDGGWETVQSATQLLGVVSAPTAPTAPGHVVTFYGRGRYPVEDIAAFLARGAAGGAPIAAIATRPHLRAIREALRARDAPAERRLATHDAGALLARRRRDDGEIDLARFRADIGALVEELTEAGRDGFLYGELVDVLAREGAVGGAVAVEEAWNDTLRERPANLYCSYALSSFASEDGPSDCLTVCDAHSEVRVDAGPEDHELVARALVRLLERGRALDAERVAALAAQRNAVSRLAQLQLVTSACSEAAAHDDLEAALEGAVLLALGAAGATVATPGDERLQIVARAGATHPTAGGDGRAAHAPAAAADAHASGAAVWLHDRDAIAARCPELAPEIEAAGFVPLRLAENALGILALSYPAAQRFDPHQRALVRDCADQVALALERIRLLDRAERRRLAAERAEARLRRANDQKNEFLAMLGHELRNPLAAVHTAAELLAMSPEADPSLRRIHDTIERQTTHMARIVDDLLDASRIVHGQVAIERAHLDLGELARTAANDLRPRIETAGLTLRVDVTGAPLAVDGDRVRLTQALHQLLENATKFTSPPGTVTVTADRDGDEATVRVADTGAGIAPELMDVIFEPFSQASQELARTSGGLGLGLSTARGLIELHRGSLTVTSDGEGRGAAFTLRLPLSRTRRERTETPLERPAVRRRRRRILVVEDSRDTADLLRHVLEAAGHDACVAYDGTQAVETAQHTRPDVVLCDIGLPGEKSGYDVARAVRANPDPEIASAFLVAVSGYGAPEDVACALDAGFDAHLTKPTTLAAIETLLTHKRAG